MNAKDAKQLAIKKLREKEINEDISDIIKKIEKCANEGLFHVFIKDVSLNKQCKLKSMGYRIIIINSGYHPKYLLISWD